MEQNDCQNKLAVAKRTIKNLEKCVKYALYLRPLPTDPLQVYIQEKCPEILEKWNDEYHKAFG